MIIINFDQEAVWGFTVQDITILWLWAFITCTLYAMLRHLDFPKNKTKMFDQYVVALINSLFIIVMGWDILLFEDNFSFLDLNADKQIIVMLLVMGYCLGDVPVIVLNYITARKKNDFREKLSCALYSVHHCLVSAIVCNVMIMGYAALLVSYLLIVYETSTIWLSGRNMLRDIGLKEHPMTWVFEKLFVVWFAVSRIGWGSFCVAYIVFEDDGMCPWMLKTFLVLFQGINCLWFYAVCKMIIFKRSEKSS